MEKKPEGFIRKWWGRYGHFDTILSLIERIGIDKILWSGGVMAASTIWGWVEQIELFYVVPIALLTVGSTLWIWNQFTAYKRAKFLALSDILPEFDERAAIGQGKDSELSTIYIGNMIVSAKGLRENNSLEIAILGFNGSDSEINISGIDGCVVGYAGDLSNPVHLPIAALRNSVRCPMRSEFLVIIYQHLPPKVAQDFLAALERSQILLDFDRLSINASPEGDLNQASRLPIWDRVSLRRRDDIVSQKVITARVEATAPALIFGQPTATATGSFEEKKNG